MRAPARATLVLLLAAAGASGAAEETLRATVVPESVPVDGTPFAIRVEALGAPGRTIEVKAWLGGPDWMASRTWDGSAWVRSDRYVVALPVDGAGRAEGWVHLRANPESANADRLAQAELEVGVRARGGEVVLVKVQPAGPDAPFVQGIANRAGVLVAERDGRVVWTQTLGFDERLEYRAPAGAELAIADDSGAREPLVHRWPPPMAPRFLLDAFSPRAPEFVRVANAGEEPARLAGVALHVGARRIELPDETLAPGATWVLASGADAYSAATLERADHVADLRLPDTGAALRLTWLSRELDRVHYGKTPPHEGWVGDPLPVPPLHRHHARDARADTNRSADFVQPPPRVARADVDASPFWAEQAEVATEPAARFALLTRVMDAARGQLRVAGYTFTSPVVAHQVADAAARGVNVTVLLDASPVGGLSQDQTRVLDALASRGVTIRLVASTPRVSAMHAKYVVADDRLALVGSENFGPGGFPSAGEGNVGHVVALHGREPAQFFAAVFDADADPRRSDVASWTLRGTKAELVGGVATADASVASNGVLVQPIVSPERSLPHVLALLAGARHSIDLAQLQLPLRWGDVENPVFQALAEAAARGVRVRGVLAWDDAVNAAAARAFANLSAQGFDVDVRLAPCCARVHAKTVVVDEARALVGSLNLGRASFEDNREVAVVLHDERVAGALSNAIRTAAEGAPVPGRDEGLWIVAPCLALAVWALWREHRGLRPRRRRPRKLLKTTLALPRR